MSRIAVFVVIAVIVLNAATALFAKSIPSKRLQNADNALTLIYVGAENCAPCDTWKRDHRDAFMDSPQFKKLKYKEVIAQDLKDVLSDKVWPAELRRYRDSAKRLMGAPSWLVVEDEQVIASIGGLSMWKKNVLPFLKNNIR